MMFNWIICYYLKDNSKYKVWFHLQLFFYLKKYIIKFLEENNKIQ